MNTPSNLEPSIDREIPEIDIVGPLKKAFPASNGDGDRAGETTSGKLTLQSGIILPGGNVSISQSAKDIFERFASRGDLFLRGGAIVEVIMEKGMLVLQIVKPSAFRSMIEIVGQTLVWRSGREGEPVLAPRLCPEATAKALLDCHIAREILLHISAVVGCPLLIETADGTKIIHKGHDRETSILVSGGDVKEIELIEARVLLDEVISEFAFQTEGDRARALAMLMTPALKLGGLICGSVPCDVGEADFSQSGKTYRQRLTAAVYGERPTIITRRDGGVGGLDESFSAALVAGRPFIQLENLRGKLASQHIEAFLTGESSFPCRLPGVAEIRIDPTRFFIQLSSNGVEATRDFANRSCIIRIFKRTDYTFKKYPEGDLLQHVRAQQPRFLGAVFAFIREWIKAGKPRSNCTDHDFREWIGVLDWISQNLLKAGPLMDGHQMAQERVSNPSLTFLRGLALAVVEAGRMGESMIASELYEIAEANGMTIPGLKEADEDRGKKVIGIIMARLFKEAEALMVDSFKVERRETMTQRESGGDYTAKTYIFTKP